MGFFSPITDFILGVNRGVTVDVEELSVLELASRTAKQLNNLGIDVSALSDKQVADITDILGKMVTTEDLSDNRKLSATGDFTGTWNGLSAIQSEAGLQAIVANYIDKMFFNVQAPPAPFASIKGDFVDDEILLLQSMQDYVEANGGGILFIPPNCHIKTSKALRVRDNVLLYGSGYTSHIENITTIGFERCTVITGNIGDTIAGTSLFDEIQYHLSPINAGDNTVTFSNIGDATQFNVGDLVFIQSEEKWGGSDAKVGKFLNMNLIESKNNATLTLKYAIPDAYTGTPAIAKLGGVLKGYDNTPTWLAKRAGVSNIRLTHKIGQTSGWYGIFMCGFECKFERIWLDSVSGVFGSNGLAHSTIKDIFGTYDVRAIDNADFQVENLYDNLNLFRTGLNANLATSYMGVGIHDGCDNVVQNSTFNFGNNGCFNGGNTQRFKSYNNKIFNALSESNKSCITGCAGVGFESIGDTIQGGKYHGVYAVGDGSKIIRPKVKGVNYTAGYYAVYLKAGIKDYVVDSGDLGVNGARTLQDAVMQQTSFDPSGIIVNNVDYNLMKNYASSSYVATSALVDTVLKTYSVPIPKRRTVIKVTASGLRSGANDVKSVKLKLGNTVITQIDYTNTETSRWYIETLIAVSENSTSPRCYGQGWKDNTSAYKNVQQVNDGMLNATTLDLTGVVANAGDSVTCDLFTVEVLGN